MASTRETTLKRILSTIAQTAASLGKAWLTILLSFLLTLALNGPLAAAKGPASGSVVIVVLGSSTAAGTGPKNPAHAWVNRYRRYIQEFQPGAQVINLAKGGYVTYKVMPTGFNPPASRPAPDPARNITKALSLNPTAILINLPSNDAASGYSVSEQLANYDVIVAAASTRDVPVWISTTQPRNLSLAGRLNLIAMRDSTFARFGFKAMDFWNGIALENGMIKPKYDSGDGVHLNDAGHGILFERAAARVRTSRIWKKSTRRSPGKRLRSF